MYVLIVLLPDAPGSSAASPDTAGYPHVAHSPGSRAAAGAAPSPTVLAARLNALEAPGGTRGDDRVVDFAPRRRIHPSASASTATHQDVELLGAFRTPESLLAAAALALRNPGVALSVGAGALDGQETARAGTPGAGENAADGGKNAEAGCRRESSGPRDLSGPALGHARAGLEELARLSPARRTSTPLRVGAEDAALAQAAAALLQLVARQIRERTDAQWRVVDLLVPGVRGQHTAVAQSLGISVQAVSRTLIRTGWAEEQAGLAAAAELLRRLDAAARS